MVAQLITFTRTHWIVHLTFIVCIKLSRTSRINPKIRCSNENVKHFFQREEIKLIRYSSFQVMPVPCLKVSEKGRNIWFSFLPPWKKKKNGQMFLNQSIRIQAMRLVFGCDLWNIPLTHTIYYSPNVTRLLLGLVLSLKEHRHHVFFAYLEQFNAIIQKLSGHKIIFFSWLTSDRL